MLFLVLFWKFFFSVSCFIILPVFVGFFPPLWLSWLVSPVSYQPSLSCVFKSVFALHLFPHAIAVCFSLFFFSTVFWFCFFLSLLPSVFCLLVPALHFKASLLLSTCLLGVWLWVLFWMSPKTANFSIIFDCIRALRIADVKTVSLPSPLSSWHVRRDERSRNVSFRGWVCPIWPNVERDCKDLSEFFPPLFFGMKLLYFILADPDGVRQVS